MRALLPLRHTQCGCLQQPVEQPLDKKAWWVELRPADRRRETTALVLVGADYPAGAVLADGAGQPMLIAATPSGAALATTTNREPRPNTEWT